MFNLKKFQLPKTSLPKAILNNVSNLDSLKEIKDKTSQRDEDLENKYNLILQSALDYFTAFAYDNEMENLYCSATKFSEALEIKRNRAEPYFYLAHIFCVLGELEKSIKYMQMANYIDPKLEGLDELRTNIESLIH